MIRDRYIAAFALFLGLGLAAWLIFWNLGKGSIDLNDEALTAGRSLYIYHNHTLLNLEVNGKVSIRKPPLVYGLTAISYRVFGIDEFGLRFPNALFGFATFIVLAWGAWKTVGPRWAWLAPWLLIGCFNLIRVSREALTDTAFVFGMTLAFLVVFVDLWADRGQESDTVVGARNLSPSEARRQRSGLKNILMPLLFGIGLATALLSKGPLALFAPLYTALFMILLRRDRLRPYILASTLALLPFAVWFVAQDLSFSHFWSIYVGQEYMERMNYHSSFLTQFVRSPLYYLSNFWRWSRISGTMAFAMTLWLGFICLKKQGSQLCPHSKQVSFFYLSGAWLGYLLLISIASHKSRRYILPIFPLISLAYIMGIKALWSLASSSLKRWLVAAIIVASIGVGIEATANHYRVVPDYHPTRKGVAMVVRPFIERGYAVYTDASHLAPILQFYLDRTVPLVPGPKAIPDKKWVFVSSSPIPGGKKINRDYYYLVSGFDSGNKR